MQYPKLLFKTSVPRMPVETEFPGSEWESVFQFPLSLEHTCSPSRTVNILQSKAFPREILTIKC